MNEFLEALQYPFMYRAVIVGVLVSLCAALLGVVLVLKRYSLIGHGLGEVGFAALTIALAWNLPTLAVSLPLVVAAAFVIIWLSQKNGVSGDVAIGVMATAALSIGVLIASLKQGFNVDIGSYMFGSILAMSDTDVYLSVGLSAVVLALFCLFFNRLFSVSYDEVNARATGVNVNLYQCLIALLTAVTVVLGMRMMGTMLISSLIIVPALSARRLAGSFRAMVVAAAAISVICFLIGIVLSSAYSLPTGASVVGVNLVCLALCSLYSLLTRGRRA